MEIRGKLEFDLTIQPGRGGWCFMMAVMKSILIAAAFGLV